MSYPTKCKDWNSQVVKLKTNLINNGGDIFHKGEALRVVKRSKDGKFELCRVSAAIIISDEDIENVISEPLGHWRELFTCDKEKIK